MSELTSLVVLQNLRDFTVQIRNSTTGRIAGTGFVVSATGDIVTCAHVVQQASTSESITEQSVVSVYFPQLVNKTKSSFIARVKARLTHSEDDVLILSLTDGPVSLAPGQVAVIGDAELSLDHPFRSYGYRVLDDYHAGRASGHILGTIERPFTQHLLGDPVQLRSAEIDFGMSGAAVLDVELNLVVGIVSATWYGREGGKDRDTCWAINAKVLSCEPFGLPVESRPHPRRFLHSPSEELSYLSDTPPLPKRWHLSGAPSLISEWVGRSDLRECLSTDRLDPKTTISQLVGFGGQGKSSLARQWLQDVQRQMLNEPGVGLFWWTFIGKESIERFFEVAITFISGGCLNPSNLTGASVRAQVLASLIKQKPYVLVLDGLEVAIDQVEDNYGMLCNAEIRELLNYLAATDHDSFCLITTRIPIFDLLMFTSCVVHDVEQLTPSEGVALLHALGMRGNNEELGKLVQQWGGHPLTLSLLAGYSDKRPDDSSAVSVLMPHAMHDDRVANILRGYQSLLTLLEVRILTITSVFRQRVPAIMFTVVLDEIGEFNPLTRTVLAAGRSAVERALRRLLSLRILRLSEFSDHYGMHPLVERYFYERTTDTGCLTEAHSFAKDAYLCVSRDVPSNPTLNQLAGLIEAVHHACKAGLYDEALELYMVRIDMGRGYLFFQCGSHDTALTLLRGFFRDDDPSKEALVDSPAAAVYLLRVLGVCAMTLGLLLDSHPLFDRSIELAVSYSEWEEAGKTIQVRSELHLHRGRFDEAINDAMRAIELYRLAPPSAGYAIDLDNVSWGVLNNRLGVNVQAICALAYAGWAYHLMGDLHRAAEDFNKAIMELQRVDEAVLFLRDLWGIYYCDHLRLAGDAELAKRVAEENLFYGERNRIPEIVSQSHRVLGDIKVASGANDDAARHYEIAVRTVRTISHRAALIEALIARGSLAVVQGKLEAARKDLEEALRYSQEQQFAVYEVDARIAFAKAFKQLGDSERARREGDSALMLSRRINYFWGAQAANALVT